MAAIPLGSRPASLALPRKSKTPRKAASVFPLPVGDETSVVCPSMISGTASLCDSARCPKRRLIHAASSGGSEARSLASVIRGSVDLGGIGEGPVSRQLPAGLQGVDVRHSLVGADPVDPGKPHREAAFVAIARLERVEGDLQHDIRDDGTAPPL